MAVRDGSDPWVAGEVLQAADLNQTFASKLPYSYGTATPSTTDSGFLWYDSNSTPAAAKFWDGAAFQALTSGKILQVVRATDSTARSTTSATLVDVTGMSVTITPQKSDSAILIIAKFNAMLDSPNGVASYGYYSITDSSNNAISGAEFAEFGDALTTAVQPRSHLTVFAYATPATTSAVTYKLRFRTVNASNTIYTGNNNATGQMYAIEVSA